MTKMFRYALYGVVGVVVLMLAGCEVMAPVEDIPMTPAKPTVPLKKRPIVPTTKLPRPRAVEAELDECNIECEELESVE